MRYYVFGAALSTFALSAASGEAADGGVQVTTDLPILQALVAEIQGGKGEVTALMSGNTSPHDWALRPSDAARLSSAELVVWVGPDLSPRLTDAIETIGEAGRSLPLMEVPGTSIRSLLEDVKASDHEDHGHDDNDHDDHDHDEHAHDEDHDHGEHDDHDDHQDHDGHEDHADHDHKKHDDHAHEDHEDEGHDDHAGHDHGDEDPHGWLSPENTRVWADAIAAALADRDPANAESYIANAAAFRAGLDAAQPAIAEMLASSAPRYVEAHDALGYFADSFNVPASAAIADGHAADPGPRRLAAVDEAIAESGASCVLIEAGTSPRLALSVAERNDLKVLEIDLIGQSAIGRGYTAWLSDMARTIAEC